MAEDRKSRVKILGPRGEVVYDQILAEVEFDSSDKTVEGQTEVARGSKEVDIMVGEGCTLIIEEV